MGQKKGFQPPNALRPEWIAKRKELMIASLIANHGIVTKASEHCGVKTHTHYKWLKEDDEYKAKVHESLLNAAYYVESKLFDRIADGSENAIMFYLKNKGRSIGYDMGRTNLDLSGGVKSVTINYLLPDEEGGGDDIMDDDADKF